MLQRPVRFLREKKCLTRWFQNMNEHSNERSDLNKIPNLSVQHSQIKGFFVCNSQIKEIMNTRFYPLLTSSMSSSSSPISSNWISSSSPGPNVSVSLILAEDNNQYTYIHMFVMLLDKLSIKRNKSGALGWLSWLSLRLLIRA